MEFRELSELLTWAEWAAFNRFSPVLKKIVVILRERGVQFDENTILQQRLTFVGYDRMITVGEDFNLEDSLGVLDYLRTTYQDRCRSSETTEFKFLRVRQMTIMQACIAVLYRELGLTIGDDPPQDPRKIKLPPTFSLESYSLAVESLLLQNKVYESDVMLGKIENEYKKNAYAILVDIFNADKDGKLSKEKVKIGLHYLLNEYSFQDFTTMASSFCRKVESEALPPPVVTPHLIATFSSLFNLDPTSSMALSTEYEIEDEVDWSERTKQQKGPYCEPASPSLKKSPRKKSKVTKEIVKEEYDTDEQSNEEVKTTESPRKRTRSSKSNDVIVEAFTNLQETNKAFYNSNVAKDPLQAALDEPTSRKLSAKKLKSEASPARVESVVGGRGRRQLRSSAKQNINHEEECASKENEEEEIIHQPKKSIASARANATVVSFGEDGDDSGDDDVEEEFETNRKSTISEKRARLEVDKQSFTKFAKKLAATIGKGREGTTEVHTNKSRTRWTSDEEDALIVGVERYGNSGWANIRDDPELRHRFNNRTNTNLKDKYRNLQRKGIID